VPLPTLPVEVVPPVPPNTVPMPQPASLAPVSRATAAKVRTLWRERTKIVRMRGLQGRADAPVLRLRLHRAPRRRRMDPGTEKGNCGSEVKEGTER
jgi:hypothetical protein